MLRNSCFNPSDDLTMEVLCLCAFFGFVGCLELSVPSPTSFPALGLRRSDLFQLPGGHFILLLRSSKTDQLHRGQFIQLSKINSSLCPSSALNRYLSAKSSLLPSDPLFSDHSGTIISRHWFSSHLSSLLSRAVLPSQSYSPHSFWIGAATSAA
ncbi:UNVERIFIED_CONTAM: hypothetical protein FKN15_060505 [Acipenser sinensis]